MRSKRIFPKILAGLGLIVGLALGCYYLILDWRARPFCHKQVFTAIRLWQSDRSDETTCPNVQGDSSSSLLSFSNEMGTTKWANDYRYVPGLHSDDPGDLVLMYVAEPTRWTWHGSVPTIFEPKAWILVPVDFTIGGRPAAGPGELSERVSTEVFRQRLEATLDFVRTNRRPHWQTVVAQHEPLLKSLGRDHR